VTKKLDIPATDTNCFVCSLGQICNEGAPATGEPTLCGGKSYKSNTSRDLSTSSNTGCQASLNSTSVLTQQSSSPSSTSSSSSSTSSSSSISNATLYNWKCEFCGHLNKDLVLQPEEIPKQEFTDYLISPPTKEISESGEVADLSDERLVVFCVDVSGSMQEMNPIPKLQAEWKLAQGEDTANITRLNAIKQALKTHVQRIYELSPKKKVHTGRFFNSNQIR